MSTSGNELVVVEDGDPARQGAEVVRDPEGCRRQSLELLDELGLPRGVLPLRHMELQECGRNRDNGFVWMRLKAPLEHYFKGAQSRVSYAAEVTAFIEKGKMRRITGIKSRQMFLWVPVSEMFSTGGGDSAAAPKVRFTTSLAVGRAYPFSAFEDEEEEGEEKSEEKQQPQ